MKIGEVVHYVSRGSADGVYAPECRAATITRAGAMDGLLDLFVVTPNGQFHDLNIDHTVPGTEEYPGGSWHTLEECKEEADVDPQE